MTCQNCGKVVERFASYYIHTESEFIRCDGVPAGVHYYGVPKGKRAVSRQVLIKKYYEKILPPKD